MSNIICRRVRKKQVFQNRNYVLLVLANMVNRFGDSVDSIVFTWLTYSITGSAAFSALIYAANKLPTVFLQPIAGVLLERREKKNIMVVTDILRALLVGYIFIRLFTGMPTSVELLAFTLMISIVEAFRQPAGSSILPAIVDKDQYAEAVSYQSGCSSAAELTGLGAGALIIGFAGNMGAMLIDIITFAGSAALLSGIQTKETKKQASEKISAGKVFRELSDGICVIRESSTMRYLILLAVVLNMLLVPFNSLQAAMAKEILHSGEQILSLAGVSLSVGMIAGSVLYPTIEKYVSRKQILLTGSLLVGALYLGTVAVGTWNISPAGIYFAEGALIFLVGIGVAFINTFANVSIVQKCDRSYLARLSGLMGSACAAATPLVSLIVSAAVGVISTTIFFSLSGILTILVCLCLFSGRMMPEEFAGKNSGCTYAEMEKE